MKQELKQRALRVRDIPKITRYLKTTGIKDRLYEVYFDKPQPKLKTWGEIREEFEMSKEDIDKLRVLAKGDIVVALRLIEGGEAYLPEYKTQNDVAKVVVDTIFEVLDEEENYKDTVALLADIYETTSEVIEDSSVTEMYQLITDIISDENFPKL